MKKLFFIILVLCIALTGCQKTPDKSSVVSKKDGLDKELILKPLKSGVKRTTDIPEHWLMNEKKSNDRVTIFADLNLGKMGVGNLPVTEWKNRSLSDAQLKKLVTYFAKGEDVYIPQIYTKEVYQNVITRMDNKEGAYGNAALGSFYGDMAKRLKEAVKLAPARPVKMEKAKVQFSQKADDPALEKAMNWGGVNVSENKDKGIWFQADVGNKRTAHIKAETYAPSAGNSSSFSWLQGADIEGNDAIESVISNNNIANKTEYTEKFGRILNQFETCFKQELFDQADGEKQAQQVLKDLDIKGMQESKTEKVLWFPNGAMPDYKGVGGGEDSLWQAELDKAETGYRYTFSRSIEGLNVMGERGNNFVKQTDDTYTSPFPVETIDVTVTASGVKGFVWRGMSEKEDTIAKNTKLLSFKKVQEQLQEQIFYYYSSQGQPADDTTPFDYSVVDADLGYTYITAFGKPEDAWLVPAWFFTVRESMGGKVTEDLPYILDALDGRIITWK